jgi:tetratricopeptide (TPR) repeat protein
LVGLCVRLPLALSIVAARAATQQALPLSTLVHELQDERDRLDVLDLGEADLDLRAVLSWSYDELSPEAARVFRLLGVHPGPDIDLHACAALAGVPVSRARALLREITSAHLLTEHAPYRFRFHDLLRVYAAERAGDGAHEAEKNDATERIIAYYLNVALLADRHIQPCRDGPVRHEALKLAGGPPAITTYRTAAEWFAAEQATLLSVVDLAAEHDGSSAWRLAWACTTFLRRTGRRHERVAVHRTALAAARRSGDRLGEVVAHRHFAIAIARLGGHDEALAHLSDVLRLSETFDDPGVHQIHLAIARVLEPRHRYFEALEHAQKAWDLVRDGKNRLGQADALTTTGRQQAMLGRYTEALADCERALALYTKLGHREGQANVLMNIGYGEQGLGLHARAIMSYERSVALDRELGDRYWEAFALDHLGDAHRGTGAHDQARRSWQEALDIFQSLRYPDTERIRGKLSRG